MKLLGIYILTNRLNGKKYVGQSHDIKKRIRTHFGGRRGCAALKSAIDKYGREIFDVEIIEYKGISQKALDALEIVKIREYNTLSPNGYNIEGGGMGGVVSEETKKKLSAVHKGKKLSKEHREKLSQAHRGEKHHHYGKRGKESYMFGKKHTEETKRKMSESKRGDNNPMKRPEVAEKVSKTLKTKSRKDNPLQLRLFD